VSEERKSVDETVHLELPSQLLHDLRTSLGHILGYAELSIEQMKGAGNEQFIPYVEKIQKSGRHLLEMMNENFQSVNRSDTNK
jgi:signal transduction histidine kinase